MITTVIEMNQSNIIPALRYRDALGAIDWLCASLGFRKHVVFESEGVVHHAELTHGGGMIMLGSYRDGPFDQLTKIPADIDNYNTQSPYIHVVDINAHYNHSKKMNVNIVMPLKEEPHGTGYTCRDPEGHLWSFGDFNPWDQNA